MPLFVITNARPSSWALAHHVKLLGEPLAKLGGANGLLLRERAHIHEIEVRPFLCNSRGGNLA